MRPQYETVEDRRREDAAAKRVGELWGVELPKIPKSCILDRAIISKRHGLIGFAEVKCRTNKKEKYPTYMVAAKKIIEASNIRTALALPSYLIVVWSDAGGWVEMDADHEVNIGGRTDRNDDADQEPCCFFHLREFNSIHNKPLF